MAEIITDTVTIPDGVVSSGLTADGGEIDVLSGGTLTDSLATNYGWIVADAGGTVQRCSATGGGDIFVNGNASELTAEDMGMFDIDSGGTLDTGLIKSDGMGAIYADATADKVTVQDGGRFLNYGGTVQNTVVTDGGAFTVQFATGNTADTSVLNGASMRIVSAGSATGTTVNGGKLEIDDGAAYTTVITGGTVIVSSGGEASGTTLTDGLFEIFSGTAAQTVITGGVMRVNPSNTITGTTLNNGELKLSAASANTTVMNGGVMQVVSGSTLFGTTVNAGLLTMDQGTITDTTILGGTASFTGVAITNIEIGSDGTVTIDSGSTLGGFADFASGASITINGTVAFDTALATAGTAQINGLSAATTGADAVYTLTDDAAAMGTYLLATDAASFNSEIKFGEYTLKVGEDVPVGDLFYTLRITGSKNLVLRIADTPMPPILVKGDRDGNGVSDVMLVSGSNYTHGYWMNASSEWWSAGATLVNPSWNNLGSYDMNLDGKADAVMVGSVNSEGDTYIGYYSAGDDADGWATIGYLPNAENVAWSNKIGNLTGNIGANSIVWYAPDMYALGAWTDGTDAWVDISNEFGGSAWTLIGCGDFDGDGRDSVLMSFNNGQSLYTVGIGEGPKLLGSLDWSNGWEICAIGDFAGDGKDDIVLYYKETGSMVMLVDGDANSYVDVGQLDAGDWFVVGAGDYNGDEKDDLLVRQYSTGMLGYYAGADTTMWNIGYEADMQWTAIA